MNENLSIDSEIDDLNKTVACVRRITRQFDNMTGRLRMRNADIAELSEEIQRIGGRGGSPASIPAGREDPVLLAALQAVEQSMARQKERRKELCQAASNFARELVRWAEDLEKRHRQQSARTPSQSTADAQTLPYLDPLVTAREDSERSGPHGNPDIPCSGPQIDRNSSERDASDNPHGDERVFCNRQDDGGQSEKQQDGHPSENDGDQSAPVSPVHSPALTASTA